MWLPKRLALVALFAVGSAHAGFGPIPEETSTAVPEVTNTSVPVPELSGGSYRQVGLLVAGVSALIVLSVRKGRKK